MIDTGLPATPMKNEQPSNKTSREPRELLIPFRTFDTRGIHREQADDITQSFFFDIYDQAFKLVALIDKANRNYQKEHGCHPEQELNDFQNVIAFIGRRGTGKTSSMISFLDMLATDSFKTSIYKSSLDSEAQSEKKYFEDAKFSFADKGFYAIPYTDASMLSKDDDIFEIVLAKMLSSLDFEVGESYFCRKRSVSENDIKRLREKICKVYNHYSSMRKKTNDSNSPHTSAYGLMEMISNKYNVRDDFVNLVDEYTDIIGKIGMNKEVDYLVICIDDIDMVSDKHMEIMQCIHQYFMIPNVIVLVSFNKPILDASLQADFFSNVSISQSDSEEHNNQMRLTRSQTYDFIRKIIPADMRITMPSWKKKDYVEMAPVKVNFGKYGDDNRQVLLKMFPRLEKSSLFAILTKSEHELDEEMLLTPKEMIMIMLSDRTSVFLDIKGFKFHFMQPDSLRGLSDMFYLLYNMEDLNITDKDSNKDNYYQNRDKNRKVLLDYLHFKMLPENNFPAETEELVNRVLDSPMERRGRIIWDYYFTLLSTDHNRNRIIELYGDEFYKAEMNRYKIEKYSFGALYRVLYSATRLNIIDRKVVIFLLASFSLSMPNFVEKEKARNNDEIKFEEPDNYIRICEAFGYSLIGTWCKDLFGNRDTYIKIKPTDFTQDSIEPFLMLLSLCSCSNQEKIEVIKNSDGTYNIKAKIDPTSFVISTFNYCKRMDSFTFELTVDNKSESIGHLTKLIEMIDIKKVGIKADCKTIQDDLMKEENLTDFFLKHTDLSYNVIKRVIADMIYTSDSNIKTIKPTGDDPFEIIAEFYQRIIIKLYEQDEKYHLRGDNRFSKIFRKNKVVSLFTDIDPENITPDMVINKNEAQKKDNTLKIDLSAKGIELIFDNKQESSPDKKSRKEKDCCSMHICGDIIVCCNKDMPQSNNSELSAAKEESPDDQPPQEAPNQHGDPPQENADVQK